MSRLNLRIARWVCPLTFELLKRSLPLSLGLGISAITWGAIAPPPAAAYLIFQTVELQRLPADTYNSFMVRAQAIAATQAQRQFEQDLLASEVSITVLGVNNGAMTAVLRLRVNRHNWQRYPDARYWVMHFASARTLLGFPQGGPTPEQLPPPTDGEPEASPPPNGEQFPPELPGFP